MHGNMAGCRGKFPVIRAEGREHNFERPTVDERGMALTHKRNATMSLQNLFMASMVERGYAPAGFRKSNRMQRKPRVWHLAGCQGSLE